VKRVSIGGGLALVGLLLGLAACGGGGGSSQPIDGPARLSSFAYVVTRCHEGKRGSAFSGSQALWIQQGDQPPLKIAEYAGGQPPIGGFCQLWAQNRGSLYIYLLGAFQRMGFTADGSQFLFEVTDDFSVNARVIPEDEQGIFAVRPDGTGLHRVAPHSEDPCFRVYWPCALAPHAGECACAGYNAQCSFGASPDGRRIAYTDIGPSVSGEQASQVFTLDLTTGERQQVTRLPLRRVSPACVGEDTDCVYPSKHPITIPNFLDNATIGYQRGSGCSSLSGGGFTVNADGTEEPVAVPVVALPGGAVVPVFQITGQAYPVTAKMPGIPEKGSGGGIVGNAISEVFVVEPPDSALLPEGRVLQLTNFRRSDTYLPHMSGQHVLFNASTNGLGTNPSNQCQIFSIDRLGSDLRQLTFFSASGDTPRDCYDYRSPGCTLATDVGLDRSTGSLLFNSTCDPLGLNPSGVEQAFAIRPDGSGLTQLTRTDGIVHHADGSIDVDMVRVFPGGRAR